MSIPGIYRSPKKWEVLKGGKDELPTLEHEINQAMSAARRIKETYPARELARHKDALDALAMAYEGLAKKAGSGPEAA